MFSLSEIDGSILPSGYEGKCLDYWWGADFLASRVVEENIQKAMQVSLLPLWKHWMQRARGEIQDFMDWILSGSADQISMQKVEVLGSSTERKGLSCVRESSINC